ncbi:MAG: hypothetical protein Q4P06_03330 [Actinomycetaceae bacterium]|nr:hypothetical protein [Actinomycetaceae bacterium]
MSGFEYFTIEANGSKATIASRGAVVTKWTVPTEDASGNHAGAVDVLDGYQSQAELEAFDGYRGALLAPWSNRIRQATYTHEGRTYDCGPDEDGVRQALHGLVAKEEFTLVRCEGDTVVLSARVESEAYPQPLTVTVEYRLEQDLHSWQLHMRMNCSNDGTGVAPVALGWHPYIKLDGGREGAYVSLPARTQVVTDEALIPLPGEAAFEPYGGFDSDSGYARVDLTQALDTAFTDLTMRPGQRAQTTATLHHASGAVTEVTALSGNPLSTGVGIFHIFTGECLHDRPGQSVAVEYCQCMTDAYNRPECGQVLALKPGSSRDLTVTIRHTPTPA